LIIVYTRVENWIGCDFYFAAWIVTKTRRKFLKPGGRKDRIAAGDRKFAARSLSWPSGGAFNYLPLARLLSLRQYFRASSQCPVLNVALKSKYSK
jgi:hypothetical protein